MSDILIPYIEKIIDFLKVNGPLAGALLIMLESIVPILPLGVFIAFNFGAYGVIPGFFISYISTCIGCIIAYYLSNIMLGIYVGKKSKDNKIVEKLIKKFKNIKFSNLVLIIALPFSPAFLINIAAGITKTDIKKFTTALLIGKLSVVYFWGMVGKSLIDSLSDIKSILIILLSLGFSYFLSKTLSKKLKID